MNSIFRQQTQTYNTSAFKGDRVTVGPVKATSIFFWEMLAHHACLMGTENRCENTI